MSVYNFSLVLFTLYNIMLWRVCENYKWSDSLEIVSKVEKMTVVCYLGVICVCSLLSSLLLQLPQLITLAQHTL